ncbi:MAG: serine/threonine-protein kinase [Pirellulales bacterium]
MLTIPPSSLGESSSLGTRFRIVRPHAEGGLGSVYVARDTELDREVALKEIQFDKADDPHNRSRFVREAEITGGLEHPGIVPVYGFGAYPDGRPFYAMKFIRGNSLKEAIARYHKPKDDEHRTATDKNLELRRLLQRFIDVCEAIDYAHARGVLHRDLKPGNIMLGRHGETLVVDWGLAKPLGKLPDDLEAKRTLPADRSTIDISKMPEAPLVPASSKSASEEPTQMGNTLGTPAFMSPEQAHGRIDLLDARSDVFSLGATLYALLTGTVPYRGTNTVELLTKAQNADYAKPRSIAKSIPRDLEAICLKAMAPAMTDRYPTAKAVADDVEHWLADEPVTAQFDIGRTPESRHPPPPRGVFERHGGAGVAHPGKRRSGGGDQSSEGARKQRAGEGNGSIGQRNQRVG